MLFFQKSVHFVAFCCHFCIKSTIFQGNFKSQNKSISPAIKSKEFEAKQENQKFQKPNKIALFLQLTFCIKSAIKETKRQKGGIVMRKITKNAVNAFVLRKIFSSGNTIVCKENNSVSCFLHGNRIASLTGNLLSVSSCGWETPTTKERLNGILKVFNLPHIVQKDFTWYFSDGKLSKNNTTFTI